MRGQGILDWRHAQGRAAVDRQIAARVGEREERLDGSQPTCLASGSQDMQTISKGLEVRQRQLLER
jgi:hypothetical protein